MYNIDDNEHYDNFVDNEVKAMRDYADRDYDECFDEDWDHDVYDKDYDEEVE